MVILRTTLLTLPLLATACLGQTPQEREEAVQGDYDDGDREHRPGQPCLLCHGADDHVPRPPGEKVIELGGTVYPFVDSNENEGLNGVEIEITDASGERYTVSSNRAGNFFFTVDTGLSSARERRGGELAIPRRLRYPLEVVIRQGEDEQRMKTLIWRNGSCAHCHGPTANAESVGRIYLFEEGAP